MSQRRKFIKQTVLSSALFIPGINALAAQRKPALVVGEKPLVLSTWNHGLPANAAALEKLKSGGTIIDAVERGVRVTESDLENLSVGLQGLPDREGITTLDASIMSGDGSLSLIHIYNGFPDLFFTGNQVANKLYLNSGGFSFKDVTETAGVAAADQWCTGTAVADINGDGWLDIYVASAMKTGPGQRNNLLFVNQGLNENGEPTFREMAAGYGIADSGNAMGAAFVDYDPVSYTHLEISIPHWYD